MDLLDVVCEVQRICEKNEACGDCPLREFRDICDVLYADGEDLKRFDRFQKKLRREAKREEYEEQWKKEAADPAPTSSTEPVTSGNSPG